MKLYKILDGENAYSIGILLYYEKAKSCIIELEEGLDEWTAPLLLTSYVKKGIFTIPRDVSRLWVRERVIPSDRQNIGAILAYHRLKSYDEMALLELADGKCAQDSLYIQKTDTLPKYVAIRQQKNLVECFPTDGGYILCFFADGTAKRVDIEKLNGVEGMEKPAQNRQLFLSGRIGPGGYAMTFDDAYDVAATDLYRAGETLPLRLEDLIAFIDRGTCDTGESCEELNCSRQNISYLIKQGSLKPIKEEVNGNLFLKSDILKTRW